MKINFINPINNQLLTSYDSFYNMQEINSTVDLLKYSEKLNSIKVQFIAENKVIKELTR